MGYSNATAPKGAIVAALRADEVVGEVLGLPVEELEGMGLGVGGDFLQTAFGDLAASSYKIGLPSQEVRERMQELVRVLEADGDGTITMQELEVAISYASRACAPPLPRTLPKEEEEEE